jgi:hypothetical protein
MENNFIYSIFIALLFSFTGVFAQDERDLVKYTHEFRFNDGIYLNFEQVKNNAPLPKYKILTDADYHDPEFFDKVLKHDIIYYFDDKGVKQELSLEDIWGYSRNGVIYIRMGNEFSRISILGGICHFVGTVTNTDTRYYDPYYNPYYNRYNPYSYYGGYGGYNNFYYPQQAETYTRTEMKQFILDFETGKVMDYSVQNVEIALMRDPELYDEYMALKSKQKKQLKFLYIRKFNESNPVYFPK